MKRPRRSETPILTTCESLTATTGEPASAKIESPRRFALPSTVTAALPRFLRLRSFAVISSA